MQTTIECGFTLKHVCDMIRTYNPFSMYVKFSEEPNILPSDSQIHGCVSGGKRYAIFSEIFAQVIK